MPREFLDDDAADHEGLTQEDLDGYASVANGEDPAELVSSVLDKLLAVGLLIRTPERERVAVAADPRIALPRWASTLHQSARAKMDASERVTDFESVLLKAYRESKPDIRMGGIEYVADLNTVNERIEALMKGCDREFLTAQPSGPRMAKDLSTSQRRDLERLERGVSMRTLYRSTVRGDATTSQWARTMTAHGLRVRTLDRAFHRMIIMDRKCAVISDVASGVAARAIIVHDAGLAAWLAAHFDAEWDLARDWDGTDEEAELVLTAEQLTILQGLKDGLTTGAIGKLMAPVLKPRTVEGRKRNLRQLTRTESDFQLGEWFGRYQERRRAALG